MLGIIARGCLYRVFVLYFVFFNLRLLPMFLRVLDLPLLTTSTEAFPLPAAFHICRYSYPPNSKNESSNNRPTINCIALLMKSTNFLQQPKSANKPAPIPIQPKMHICFLSQSLVLNCSCSGRDGRVGCNAPTIHLALVIYAFLSFGNNNNKNKTKAYGRHAPLRVVLRYLEHSQPE